MISVAKTAIICITIVAIIWIIYKKGGKSDE